MSRLGDWWRRVTGRAEAQVPPLRPVARPAKPAMPAKPVGSDLELADDTAPKRPARGGAAGFDPYSSDAGYAKPHSWERVDHD